MSRPADTMGRLSRRAMLAGTAAAGTALTTFARAHSPVEQALKLAVEGAERAMPDRWLGYNAPANYDIPVEDPKFLRAVEQLAPHYLRFPGGTVSNYYQPETGQLDFTDFKDGSIYRKYLQKFAGSASRQLHPNGVFVDQYVSLAREMGAELLIVPNLETSSAESQRAWFAKMNAGGFVPREIEMGNEFYLAMLMDKLTLSIFPDWAATIRRTETYAKAIAPYIAPDARICVQAAATSFHNPHGDAEDPRAVRELKWDNDMRPEPWFQAVSIHLYPQIESSAGKGSLAGLPGNFGKVFPAFMARADEGFDRAIADTAARMPGKEIWLTEWGAFEAASTLAGAKVDFDGMWLHMITRGLMAQLRHREVTLSTHHSLFAQGNLMSAFRRTNAAPDGRNDLGGVVLAADGYAPINFAGMIHWFCEASRGPDAHYARITVDGSRRVEAQGTLPGESYRDVEACMFRQGARRSVFIQNASETARSVDLTGLVGAETPVAADAVITSDMHASLQMDAPEPTALTAAAGKVMLPAWSVARLRWSV